MMNRRNFFSGLFASAIALATGKFVKAEDKSKAIVMKRRQPGFSIYVLKDGWATFMCDLYIGQAKNIKVWEKNDEWVRIIRSESSDLDLLVVPPRLT